MWRVFPRVRAGWGETGGRRPAGLFFLVLHFIRHGVCAAHVVDDGDAMEAGHGADEDGSLGALRGVWGWSILAIIWSLAFAGIVLKDYGKHRSTE